MNKNFVYNIILSVDKLFIILQFFILKLFVNEKKRYTLFNIGWGILVQTIFYLNLIHKQKNKIIIILDYKKINVSIEKFTKNCKVKKIYSIFIIVNKDFSPYPNKYQKNLNNFCNNLFKKEFTNAVEIIYGIKKNFYFKKILSTYLKKKLSKNLILFDSLKSLNDQNYKFKKKKFFYPNANMINQIKDNFGISVNEIENSINICIRKRNLNYKNNDRTNYLRDGNINNFKFVIKELLKNYNYKIFITGDMEEINFHHKNLYCYKNFKNKISKDYYQLCIQTLTNFHILNSGGGNQIMKFNNGKFLYIDCWPPINQTSNSVILYKNIFDKKKKIFVNCFEYIKMYEKDCFKEKIKNLEVSKKIFLKYFEAKNYDIIDNNRIQILKSLDEFIKFISPKKKLNLKNKTFNKVSSFYKKILLENRCLLSSGNLNYKSK